MRVAIKRASPSETVLPISRTGTSVSLQRLTQIGKNMTTLTLAVMAVLCLVFETTRKYSLLCIALLLFLYPYWGLGVLAAAAGPILYYHFKR